MPRKSMGAMAALVAIAALLPQAAAAGTVVLAKSSSDAVRSSGHIYVQDGSVRIEWASQGPVHTLIYRGRTGTTWVLDDVHRSYLETDRDALERRGEPGGAQPQATYRRVASGVRLNGFTTDQYEVVVGNEKVKELWLTAPAALKLSAADMAALTALASLGGAAAEGSAGGAWSVTAGEGGPEGVAVRLFRYQDGKRVWSSEITGVLHQDLPATLFAPPKGFRKQKLAR
jgi:hypothetical protein